MKKKLIIIMLVCLPAFYSRGQDSLLFSAFPKEETVHFEEFMPFKKGQARKLFLDGSTLYIWANDSDEGYFFYACNLNDKNQTGRYFTQGNGRGQLFSPFSGGIHNGMMWLHDLNLDKIVTIQPSKESDVVNEYKIPRFYYSLQLTDSFLLWGSGADHSQQKLQQIDMRTGQELKELGTFSNAPAGIPFYSWKNAYESFLFTRPSGGKAALAARLTDLVEVFDLENGRSRQVKGPENYPPAFRPIQSFGKDLAERISQTRFAFVNGAVTDRYIYLLYSGNNHESRYLDQGMYIFVYDWQGNPVKRLTCDRYIKCFTVSDDDSSIYAFDVSRKAIVKMTGK
ncbi:BF3164 family lipoprotein [Sediminibacterium ginsengisoli]|uniref:TolB-like 6-blade propeller-like n=1 Tax=Sediminibacterium ginsengisoli TaxID=413434 RepID=A0A1T4R1Z8_9BACT|nr:BF3164 family lipoprotein [Sediminibacterium ginsengisoli]SKA10040.1 TolB-like 6-blade propeller-like [Sediminibacterium ginsengisoli]